MSGLFPYICTTQTADPFVPAAAVNLQTFARDVSDAFYAIQGGFKRVGEISLYPIQKAVPLHLLCDGKEVAKTAFPQLYEYLGDAMGTPADAANFVLPNLIGGALEPAATAVTETVEGGTVTSEPSSPGGGSSGGSESPAVDSGGRTRSGGLVEY